MVQFSITKPWNSSVFFCIELSSKKSSGSGTGTFFLLATPWIMVLRNNPDPTGTAHWSFEAVTATSKNINRRLLRGAVRSHKHHLSESKEGVFHVSTHRTEKTIIICSCRCPEWISCCLAFLLLWICFWLQSGGQKIKENQ